MPVEDYYEQVITEADALDRETTDSFRRRLVAWAIRWTIGFALIALVTRSKPNLSWLWRAGAGVALLSLIVNLVGNRLVQERLAQIRRKTEAQELPGSAGGEA